MPPRSSRSISVIMGLSLVFSLMGTARVRATDAEKEAAQPVLQAAPERPERPARLRPLYISLAALQVLDVHFTRMALNSNSRARETNPLMGNVSGSTVSLIVLKAAATVSTYYLSERLWKKNRAAAVWTMIALNVGYGLIVTNNYRVATSGAPGR